MERLKFELDEQETQDAKDWIEEHRKVCPYSFKRGNLPATGEHFYYRITPGGLGLGIEVGCVYCKKARKDVTNVSNW